MNESPSGRGLAAPLALPAGFAALLVIGAVAAALHGRLPAGAVLALAAVVVGAGSLVAEPAVAPLLAGIGWLTAVGFAGPPAGRAGCRGTCRDCPGRHRNRAGSAAHRNFVQTGDCARIRRVPVRRHRAARRGPAPWR